MENQKYFQSPIENIKRNSQSLRLSARTKPHPSGQHPHQFSSTGRTSHNKPQSLANQYHRLKPGFGLSQGSSNLGAYGKEVVSSETLDNKLQYQSQPTNGTSEFANNHFQSHQLSTNNMPTVESIEQPVPPDNYRFAHQQSFTNVPQAANKSVTILKQQSQQPRTDFANGSQGTSMMIIWGNSHQSQNQIAPQPQQRTVQSNNLFVQNKISKTQAYEKVLFHQQERGLLPRISNLRNDEAGRMSQQLQENHVSSPRVQSIPQEQLIQGHHHIERQSTGNEPAHAHQRLRSNVVGRLTGPQDTNQTVTETMNKSLNEKKSRDDTNLVFAKQEDASLTPQTTNSKRQHSQQQRSFNNTFAQGGTVNQGQHSNLNARGYYVSRGGTQTAVGTIRQIDCVQQKFEDVQRTPKETHSVLDHDKNTVEFSPPSAKFVQQFSGTQPSGILVGGVESSTKFESSQRDHTKTPTLLQSSQHHPDGPKIPVICGFHRRIVLLTAGQQGQQIMNTGNRNTLSRVRNKNPNCNHNNNFVFYQPHYNNVKYDDSYKKKEEILRKVFFKECAKEEEKRMVNAQNRPQQIMNSDPQTYLKILEEFISEELYPSSDYPFQEHVPHLQQELGIYHAKPAHKAYLLALLKGQKITKENLFKILGEYKTYGQEIDQECIYCRYSQYALKESLKTGKSGDDSESKDQKLARMFQSQLFKKSFVNTSLLIIQKKMNEKIQQTQQMQAQQQQTNNQRQLLQYRSSSTSGGQELRPLLEKKKSTVGPSKGDLKKVLNTSGIVIPNLDQIKFQMDKLAKNLSNPKDKDKFLELKEKYLKEFLNVINVRNGITITFPKASFTPYKYFIGRGNNSMLIRACFKSRFWWSMGDFDEWEDYNFMWTQWKNNKILSILKPNSDSSVTKDESADRSQSAGTLSTQVTTTENQSQSSVENLINTPKRKRTSGAGSMSVQTTTALRQAGKVSTTNSASKSEVQDPKKETSHTIITCNHMENNFHLSNKKAIYYNMKLYYELTNQNPWDYLPLTFHIKEGVNDKEFARFMEVFNGNTSMSSFGHVEKFGKSVWIIKPGENTNRGCGIQVAKDISSIREMVSNTNVNGKKRSYIIQKYIEKPLLFKQRKFDIRCFALLTTVNGNLCGYWYNEGYLRTSSKEFHLKNVTNRLIHLTNDAVQKKSDDYGKFESGNKLSYVDFQKYLDSQGQKCDIVKKIVPKLKKIALDTIKATYRKLDPHRRNNSFEIFGYDFMIDEDYHPWLIEVNTNPCLELSCPYLARLIPQMLENAMKQVKSYLMSRVAVDPLFPPPAWPNSKKHLLPDASTNKFEIVFNESTDASDLKGLPLDDDKLQGIIEEEELEDEGSDDEEDDQ